MNQKCFSRVTIVIIITTVVLAGWWYWSQKFSPTVDWQTYRNEQFGFEVKYPDDWEHGVTIGGELTLKPEGKPGNYPNFRIIPYAVGGTSVDILKSFSGYEGLGGWESVTIDGFPGITKKVIKDSKVVDGRVIPGEIYYVGYLVEGPKFIYEITTSQEKDIDFETNKILLNDQILPTFKFIK